MSCQGQPAGWVTLRSPAQRAAQLSVSPEMRSPWRSSPLWGEETEAQRARRPDRGSGLTSKSSESNPGLCLKTEPCWRFLFESPLGKSNCNPNVKPRAGTWPLPEILHSYLSPLMPRALRQQNSPPVGRTVTQWHGRTATCRRTVKTGAPRAQQTRGNRTQSILQLKTQNVSRPRSKPWD